MKWRLGILILLAFLTVDYRAMAVYTRYFSPELSTQANFRATYRNGAMVVTKIDDPCKAESGSGPCLTHPHPGDRIREIYDGNGEGGAVKGSFSYGGLLRPINADENWTLVVDRPVSGERTERVVLTMPPATPIDWPLDEYLVNLGFDVYLPLLAMAAGLFIGFMKPNDKLAFLAALVFLGFSTSFRTEVSQFPAFWREIALVIRTIAYCFSPYLILKFFLRFPRRSPLDRKAPWLSPLFLLGSTVIFCLEIVTKTALHLSFDAFQAILGVLETVGLTYGLGIVTFRIFVVAAILLSLTSLTWNTLKAEHRNDRRRMKFILGGAVVGLVPFMAMYMFGTGVIKTPLWVLLAAIPLIGLFPISFVYSIVRYRVFGIRLILRRGLKYALVSRGFLIGEGIVLFVTLYFAVGPFLTSAVAPLLSEIAPGSGASLTSISIAAVTLALVAGTRRVNQVVLPKIDRKFFRDAYNTQRILTDLSKAVRLLASRPDQLISKVTDEIAASLHPDQMAIFLAEKPWPKLAPVDAESPACWEAGPQTKIRDRFLLYVHRDLALGGKEGRSATLPEGAILTSRVSLSRLLHSSMEHGRETLDVFPVHSRRRNGETEAGTGPCLIDRTLFGRFNTQLVVPLATAGKVLGFMALGEKLSEEPYSAEDKELLLAVAEQVAIALDYSLLIGRVAEQKQLEREIQIAQDVQNRLFPSDLPPFESLDYTGSCKAARGVGGDYYDFLHLSPGRLGIAVADIAGKGLSASLLMASLQALVRSHAPTHSHRLREMAWEINQHLCESTDDARFATFFYGVYEEGDRSFRYVNAGHNPPIVIRSGGEIQRLEAGGLILGAFEERTYEEASTVLHPGDLLVIFSDGIVEAMNEHGEEFGDHRLVETIREANGASARDLQDRILDEVNRFTGPVPPHDDMTLIVARIL